MSFTTKILFLFALMFSKASIAEFSRPGDPNQPTKVYVSVFIINLSHVDTANQKFEANLYYIYRWFDSRLAHPGNDKIIRPLKDVWTPRIQIVNQQRVIRSLPDNVEISSDGEVLYAQRVWGAFSQPLELEDFPFDHQTFKINLAAVRFSPNQIDLVPDPEGINGIADNISVTDWTILNSNAQSSSFQPSPKSRVISGYTLDLEAERKVAYYFVNIIIPLLLIVAMSWVVFWIDPVEFSGTKISIAVTSMLTLIAYRFAIGTKLPKLSYLTRLDEFILSSTLLVFAGILVSVSASVIAKSKNPALAFKLDRWSRWISPTGLILVAYFTLFHGIH